VYWDDDVIESMVWVVGIFPDDIPSFGIFDFRSMKKCESPVTEECIVDTFSLRRLTGLGVTPSMKGPDHLELWYIEVATDYEYGVQ